MLGGAGEMLARLAVLGGFRGATQPVPGTACRKRPVRDFENAGEMPARRLWIVQRPQRIPAGMKFGVGDIGRFGCHMAGDDAVSLAILAEIGKPARDDPLFVPPGAAADQLVSLARHLFEKLCRFFVALLPAQVFDADIEECRILGPGFVDGGNQRIDIL